MEQPGRTITTKIPARMDRLPWSRFHWRVLLGLGTVWVLDGLEVTIIGSVAARLTEEDSGIPLTAADIGFAAACYIAGACLGALLFGRLTDTYGRKKLFIATLVVYVIATVATAFAFSPWYFFLTRFITGAGIGGEYAAVNSAVDELIPARVRGRVDLVVNGTYWFGAAIGSALAILLLNTDLFAADLGWRLAFGLGAALGLVILVVRRHVPESPRWLFIHGREDEAERVVGGIERDITAETGQELSEPDRELKIRQRRTIPFREIARTAFRDYPKRTLLGLALFVGQAFIYNGITFNLGTLFSGYYAVDAGAVPLFLIVYALGNLLGPLTLGRLFDTVGRKPMIAGTYLGSAALTVPLIWLFVTGTGGEWGFLAMLVLTFFVASAGASAAYLTVSEIFPMETRALAIAFFYAIGTGLGGIIGPLLFGAFIGSGERGMVGLGFGIAAVVMAVGGVVELLFGVRSERASLEDIAAPLTAQDEPEGKGPGAAGRADAADSGTAASRTEGTEPVSDDSAAPGRAGDGPSGVEAEGAGSAGAEAGQRGSGRRGGRLVRGARAVRLGPGSVSGGRIGAVPVPGEPLDREVELIAIAVAEGAVTRVEVARRVGARLWGPGRFVAALREAVRLGRVRRVSRSRYAPPG